MRKRLALALLAATALSGTAARADVPPGALAALMVMPGGSNTLVDLATTPPATAVYADGNGYLLQVAFTGVAVPANPIRAQMAEFGATNLDANTAEYTHSIYTYINSGLAPTWVAGTVYLAGREVIANNNIYKTTFGGTAGLTAPAFTSGTGSDGGVTWAYVGPNSNNQGKVSLFIATSFGPLAGGAWGLANDAVLQAGGFVGLGAFYAGHEDDISDLAGDCVPGVCNAYDLYLSGLTNFRITAVLALTTPATTNYAAYYGALFGPAAKLASDAGIEMDINPLVGIDFGGIVSTTFATATLEDQSTSPISEWCRGAHSTACFVANGNGSYAFYALGTYVDGLFLAGTASSWQILGNAFSVDPTGGLIVSAIQDTGVTTGTPASSACWDSGNHLIKKTTAGPCI